MKKQIEYFIIKNLVEGNKNHFGVYPQEIEERLDFEKGVDHLQFSTFEEAIAFLDQVASFEDEDQLQEGKQYYQYLLSIELVVDDHLYDTMEYYYYKEV